MKKLRTIELIDKELNSFLKSKKHKELKEMMGYTALFSSAALLGRALRW